MITMEEKFLEACKSQTIRGAVLLASDVSGKFHYQNVFGAASETEPLTLDSTFMIASCTKLMTTIAAMQCIERGQLKLDDDVSTILHELKDIEILTGFEEETGKPLFEKAKNKITLRQLLTHSSGLSYDSFSPILQRWREYRGEKISQTGSDFNSYCLLPLLFEPGTSWEYGTGIDWAGLMVERVSNMDLQSYQQKYLWEPLGIKDMTYHLEERPDIRERLPTMSKRTPGSATVEWTDRPVLADPIKVAFGGAGIYSTATDYLLILKSIASDDGRLLQPSSVEEMFRPQLSKEAKQQLLTVAKIPEKAKGFAVVQGADVDFGLGGLMVSEDVPSARKSGSMSWGGYPNLKWWIDRKTKLYGLYASQVIPPADPPSLELNMEFQTAMYDRFTKSSSS